MTWVDALGYVAASLVLATFCMKTMLLLRSVAICSNVAFLIYGVIHGIYPVLALHGILLPLNLACWLQVRSSADRARRFTQAKQPLEWLQLFEADRRYRKGEIVFRKGDFADRLYLIVTGEVELTQISERLRSGEFFGEIGLFSPERRRTQTVRTATDVDLLRMDGAKLQGLCEQDPRLSLYLLRLAATRLAAERSRS